MDANACGYLSARLIRITVLGKQPCLWCWCYRIHLMQLSDKSLSKSTKNRTYRISFVCCSAEMSWYLFSVCYCYSIFNKHHSLEQGNISSPYTGGTVQPCHNTGNSYSKLFRTHLRARKIFKSFSVPGFKRSDTTKMHTLKIK